MPNVRRTMEKLRLRREAAALALAAAALAAADRTRLCLYGLLLGLART